MASKKHRVLLYTLSEDAMLADAILDGCGVRDQIELVGVPHDIFVPITEGAPDELERGCDAIVNEIAGISEAGAPAVAASGARLFASLSIGVNHIATDALARKGVLATNCPGYCTEDVALHTIALTLDLMRKVTSSNRDVVASRWDPYFGYPVHRPSTQTLRIGKHFVLEVREPGRPILITPCSTGRVHFLKPVVDKFVIRSVVKSKETTETRGDDRAVIGVNQFISDENRPTSWPRISSS